MSRTLAELPAEENGLLSKPRSFCPAAHPWVSVWALLFLHVLFFSGAARAEIQQHLFDISGDNGEVGSGYFTWDDQIVADGDPVAASLANTGDVIELYIEISGGNVIGGGGTTVFELSDCVGAFLENAPDFSTDINFVCNNTVNTLSGFSPNINYLNDTADAGAGLTPPVLGPSSSTLTFTPFLTRPRINSVNPVPAVPIWVLLFLVVSIPLTLRRCGGCR